MVSIIRSLRFTWFCITPSQSQKVAHQPFHKNEWCIIEHFFDKLTIMSLMQRCPPTRYLSVTACTIVVSSDGLNRSARTHLQNLHLPIRTVCMHLTQNIYNRLAYLSSCTQVGTTLHLCMCTISCYDCMHCHLTFALRSLISNRRCLFKVWLHLLQNYNHKSQLSD